MSYTNTLTPLFKDFAECINATSLSCQDYNIDTYTKARIVFGRLYYACFHKGLEDFPSIRTSTKGKKHQRLIKALEDSTNPNHQGLYDLITKLNDLRIWADYDYTNDIYRNARPAGLGYYIYQANSILI